MPKPNRAQRRHPAKTSPGHAREVHVINPGKASKEGPKGDVFLGYLTGDTITQSFHRSLFDLVGYDMSTNQRLFNNASARCGALMLPKMRNNMVAEMLASTCEWLFMVDSDMGFEPNTLDRLLSAGHPTERPIVGALCFMQREAEPDTMGGVITYPAPTIYKWQPNPETGHEMFIGQQTYPVNTLVKVGATGAACLIIHRSALEKIGSDWFSQIVGTDGELAGEDISFFIRCRDLDIPAAVHTGVRTSHYKHLWLSEADFWISRVADPATERVDVIVPTLGQRPDNIPRLLNSLKASTGLATAWYVVEPGDTDTALAVTKHGGRVIFEAGTFAHKVNHAYREIGEKREEAAPWLLLVGDDVGFRPGWLDQAQETARAWDANVVGTNDLANIRVIRGEHSTHPMIRRSYVDEVGASWDGPGIVCHEGYQHCYVDDEICLAAMSRHTFQAALAACVPHYHPMTGRAKNDAVYRKGQRTLKADGELFQRRVVEVSGLTANPVKQRATAPA